MAEKEKKKWEPHWYLLTGPSGIWLARQQMEEKKRREAVSAALDDLDRLYKLKESGVITEEELQTLKEKLKERD